MENSVQKLAIVSSRGHDDERATVAWTIANAGVASGQQVTMFLVSSAIDTVRKGAADNVRMNPFDPPMGELIATFLENGGRILACPPCAKVRGYTETDLVDGVEIVGSPALHALIKDGAATLSF
ncbi:DsrE family protein [Tropicimonas isoalkanivorans]|uniref:Predicted peroxiredoxin n=1 Tax=Tropicimonas isoalkanivorans TaxID=441112 RepID=A0A1I1GHW2_9RHOB|nr:DsrE family protein [Tropicimonas isoalkanivorans]SFC08770.1 Predicted peroxiredoxin [Tropicimonas isoalkanivorans]